MNEIVIGLYRKAVSLVCQEAGVSESGLIDGKSELYCDARYVLVKVLSVRLTDTEIACMMGKTRQMVNAIRNGKRVLKWSTRKCYDAVCNELATDAQ